MKKEKEEVAAVAATAMDVKAKGKEKEKANKGELQNGVKVNSFILCYPTDEELCIANHLAL